MDEFDMRKEDHVPIFDKLREVSDKLDVVNDSLQAMKTATALQNAVTQGVIDRLIKLETKVDSTTQVLYGTQENLGLLSKVQYIREALEKFNRVIWLVVGGAVSAIVISTVSLWLDKVRTP